jgi:hypothetical protein
VLHTHFSWVGGMQAFLAVVIIGTLWKLVAMHLMATDSENLNHIGRGMAFQYS